MNVIKTALAEIRDFRVLFLHESNFQFICNKCHDYGWADTYLFTLNDVKIGYGCVWGTDRREDRDTIFEFYIIKPYRKIASQLFPIFHTACGATLVESQTNDALLSSMLYEYTQNVRVEAILFEDHFVTSHTVPDTIFRKKESEDKSDDAGGDYVLEQNGEIVASGGLMLNYNIPYADIYMQVKEPYRRRGFGSLIVQELKREAYRMGRVPAARCNVNNSISKATLVKAGFRVCGHWVKGDFKKEAL